MVVNVDVRIPIVAIYAIAHKGQTLRVYVSIMERSLERLIGVRSCAHGLNHHCHWKTNRATPRGAVIAIPNLFSLFTLALIFLYYC